MSRNALRSCKLVICCFLALAGGMASADDGATEKGKPIPAGTWEKKDADPALQFTGDDKLMIFPHGGNVDFQVECSYTVTKEGLVKAKVTRLGGPEKLVEKAKGSVPVGLEFHFKWKAEGEKATLEDLDGEDVEHVKERLQGDYTKKS